jgi:hypothetical protein
VGIPNFDQTERWLGSSTPRDFHLGIGTAIVQIAAMAFVLQDISNADKFNAAERSTKGVSAILSLGATLVEMCAATAKLQPSHPIAAFLPNQWTRTPEGLARVIGRARGLGFLAGIITGIYDLFNSLKAFSEKKDFLGVLYGVNGGLGLAIAFAAYFTLPIFWPLFILSFIVGIVIALVSPSAIQDWLSRCYFSSTVSAIRGQTKDKPPFKLYPYTTAISEFSAFKSAIGV